MCWCGGMADASDSKSDVREYMWVQVPPPAPIPFFERDFFCCGGVGICFPPRWNTSLRFVAFVGFAHSAKGRLVGLKIRCTRVHVGDGIDFCKRASI